MHQPNTECMSFESSVLSLVILLLWLQLFRQKNQNPKQVRPRVVCCTVTSCLPQYARGDVKNVVHVKVRTVSCAQAVKT